MRHDPQLPPNRLEDDRSESRLASRVALGHPGHLEGPEVAAAVAYWARTIPYVVGKKAGAPES